MNVMAVNVVGGAICAKAELRSMLAPGGGSIINMSSVTALLGRTGNLHYVTSKAAQLGFKTPSPNACQIALTSAIGAAPPPPASNERSRQRAVASGGA